MVANNLIRTTLKKFISRNGLSMESVITVNYMPVTSFSEESKHIDCPAWVGAVSTELNVAVMGCFDGQLRTANWENLTPLSSVQAHSHPIRSIAAWQHANALGIVATASKDQSVRCWQLLSDGTFECLCKLESSLSSVECVAYWGEKNTVLSGDWAGNIFAYDVSSLSDKISQGTADETGLAKKKKRKLATSASQNTTGLSDAQTASSSGVTLPHMLTIHAHSQAVSCMQLGAEACRLYTGSWDHSMKEWDLDRQECVATFAGAKVVTALAFSATTHLIASSHPDGRIKLWDSRNRDSSVCVNTFTNGEDKRWVSDVKWHPTNSHIFGTTDYDGTVRAWDTRAALPLSTASAHDGKALCLSWYGEEATSQVHAVSGGSDCCLRMTPLLQAEVNAK